MASNIIVFIVVYLLLLQFLDRSSCAIASEDFFNAYNREESLEEEGRVEISLDAHKDSIPATNGHQESADGLQLEYRHETQGMHCHFRV